MPIPLAVMGRVSTSADRPHRRSGQRQRKTDWIGRAVLPYGPEEIVSVIVPVYVPAWASAGNLIHDVTAKAIAPMPLVVDALATVVGAHVVPLVPHVAVTSTG
jgi:hypothetical protein